MQLRNLMLAGVLTWVIVALPHVRNLDDPLWAACYVAFIVLFVITARNIVVGRLQLTIVAAESVLALICCMLQPGGMQPVLLVLVAAQLGCLSGVLATTWLIVQTVALWLLVGQPAGRPWTTLGYFAFQLFGFLAARAAFEERAARQELAEANAELRVATGLLEMSSRAEERLRIARDLHDLMGHHLTALTLNLEVASHVAEGQAKEQIEKSKAIARLLLSDVRDVVSRLRENEPIDLRSALESLRDAVTSPSIHVQGDVADVTEPLVAGTALRAVQEIVTNAVRHSNARNLWLDVSTTGETLTVDARDDGDGTDHILFGNGLRGMRERIQQAGGTLEIASMRGRGFEVHVRLPRGGVA